MGEKKAALVALRKLKKREVKKLLVRKAEEWEKSKAGKKPSKKPRPKKMVARKRRPAQKKKIIKAGKPRR